MIIFLSSGAQVLLAQTSSVNQTNNVMTSMNSNVVQSGIGTTILLVFIALALLLWGFRLIGNLMVKKESAVPVQQVSEVVSQNSSDEEVSAAITMALHLYTSQIHDQENPVITMIKVSRTYSPWSSKIYGLRKSPR